MDKKYLLMLIGLCLSQWMVRIRMLCTPDFRTAIINMRTKDSPRISGYKMRLPLERPLGKCCNGLWRAEVNWTRAPSIVMALDLLYLSINPTVLSLLSTLRGFFIVFSSAFYTILCSSAPTLLWLSLEYTYRPLQQNLLFVSSFTIAKIRFRGGGKLFEKYFKCTGCPREPPHFSELLRNSK